MLSIAWALGHRQSHTKIDRYYAYKKKKDLPTTTTATNKNKEPQTIPLSQFLAFLTILWFTQSYQQQCVCVCLCILRIEFAYSYILK